MLFFAILYVCCVFAGLPSGNLSEYMIVNQLQIKEFSHESQGEKNSANVRNLFASMAGIYQLIQH